MAIETHKIDVHWNYFLALGRSLDDLSRYVELDKRNYECFSIEIARLLLACGSEADVLCKQLCNSIKPKSCAENIHDYRDEIVPAFPSVPGFEVRLPQYGLALKPWSEWRKKDGVPVWWTAYNKTKHHATSITARI